MHSKINRKRCFEPMLSISHPKNTLTRIQNFQINNFTFLKLFDTLWSRGGRESFYQL